MTGSPNTAAAVEKAASSEADGKETGSVDPWQRRVTLNAESMPLGEILADVCRQAGVKLTIDESALAAANVDLSAPLSVTLKDVTLNQAFHRVFEWKGRSGVQREMFLGGRRWKSTMEAAYADLLRATPETEVIVSTNVATYQQTMENVPDWLLPLQKRSLIARVDQAGQVDEIHVRESCTDETLAQLPALPNLRVLSFGTTRNITLAGLAPLSKLTALEELSLGKADWTPLILGDEVLRQTVGLENLRILTLRRWGVSDAGMRYLELHSQLADLSVVEEDGLTDDCLASIAKLQGLRRLSLTAVGSQKQGTMQFSPEAVRQLAALRDLESLDLDGQGFHHDLCDLPHLRHLSIGGPTVDDATAVHLARCQNLESLSLSSTNISDEGLKSLAALPRLHDLRIDSHRISDQGIANLTSLPHLALLNLRTGRITDESLKHLVKAESLVSLRLEGAWPTIGLRPAATAIDDAPQGKNNWDEGVLTVEGIQQLKVLPNLQYLALENMFSDSGFQGLAELQQLCYLELMMTTIRKDELVALQRSMPNTRISVPFGTFP